MNPKGRTSPDSRYGPWKFIHEIGVEDLKTHPIWLWCLALGLPDEEDGPLDGDEASMRPLLDSRNIERGMLQPLILLRVKGRDYYASGLYEHQARKVVSVSIEPKSPDEATTLTRVGGLRVPVGWSAPLIFISVPTIAGQPDVEFRCNSLDKAEAEVA
jgi:hypothetical protein